MVYKDEQSKLYHLKYYVDGLAALDNEEANWKSPSVPEKFRMTRLSFFATAAMAVGISVQT